MFDFPTMGRGFENAAAPWIWGTVLLVAAVFWFMERRRIKRWEREEREERESNED
ncbi:hypothetical protein [Jannaschia seohaensis]|uniref:Heme exporter protein D n=1 Tax=Jannaschia seohaensis TaxID=475081 RepID=A0A2Y9B4J6_9RHOB|nr:hypothetical protein [Jannaschia seohaensis]PWJ15068.1 hypothetical protein BCF38_11185 [Jannaschia seohaensis]SSA49917.1 hypothetical protein SAMN05421539_11185 [Jannaschia seohaensis]